MRHPAPTKAKSVFALATGAVLAFATATAMARDAAARRIIGFSPDGPISPSSNTASSMPALRRPVIPKSTSSIRAAMNSSAASRS
ncbi:hypothetical protein [Mesorhizobium huakuii]|uniref:ABC transporter substrate-binding protein n=1 Tax=Mesorhizobium huakuii TaxID=28104 RepID=A0ABZ0VGK1_9HYPH|nr:hypothetical protein [Mesorhizobium huakuii]WQB96413.1 hypothetical protein U0R22_000467 [Mesorhizobium huakuii]